MAYLYRHQKVPYYTNIVYELSEDGGPKQARLRYRRRAVLCIKVCAMSMYSLFFNHFMTTPHTILFHYRNDV